MSYVMLSFEKHVTNKISQITRRWYVMVSMVIGEVAGLKSGELVMAGIQYLEEIVEVRRLTGC